MQWRKGTRFTSASHKQNTTYKENKNMADNNKYLMQQILDAAQSVTYNNLSDAKESLRNALDTIEAKEIA